MQNLPSVFGVCKYFQKSKKEQIKKTVHRFSRCRVSPIQPIFKQYQQGLLLLSFIFSDGF